MLTLGTKAVVPAGLTLFASVILHADAAATIVPSSFFVPYSTSINIATATSLVLFNVALPVPVSQNAAERGSICRGTGLHAKSVVRHIRKSCCFHVLIHTARAIRWIR